MKIHKLPPTTFFRRQKLPKLKPKLPAHTNAHKRSQTHTRKKLIQKHGNEKTKGENKGEGGLKQ